MKKFAAMSSAFFLAVTLMAGVSAHADDQAVSCASVGFDFHECQLGDNAGIVPVKQESQSPCIMGQTLKIFPHSVWVTQGCRETVLVHRSENITCQSQNDAPTLCPIHQAPNADKRAVAVKMLQQLSSSPCTDHDLISGERKSFGLDGNGVLWTAHGCRGVFEVAYPHSL
jgi:hypothetical protein